jgi:cysteinyl-tRNA synthetase
LYDIRYGFVDAMDDDLNISAALASIFRMIRKINRLIAEEALNPSDAAKIIDVFKKIDTVLNLFEFESQTPDADVQRLMEKRDLARQQQNWDLADQIRNELISRGVVVRDREKIT